MLRPLRWAVSDLRKFFKLTAENRPEYLFFPQQSFTRKRMLTFEHTAMLVLSLLKKASAWNCSIFSQSLTGHLHLKVLLSKDGN